MSVGAGGSATNVYVYYCKLGKEVEDRVRVLRGDDGIREFIKLYEKIPVAIVYVVDGEEPLSVVSPNSNEPIVNVLFLLESAAIFLNLCCMRMM